MPCECECKQSAPATPQLLLCASAPVAGRFGRAKHWTIVGQARSGEPRKPLDAKATPKGSLCPLFRASGGLPPGSLAETFSLGGPDTADRQRELAAVWHSSALQLFCISSNLKPHLVPAPALIGHGSFGHTLTHVLPDPTDPTDLVLDTGRDGRQKLGEMLLCLSARARGGKQGGRRMCVP
ncbi:hypothetical protein B0H67DRAFT_374248 [Lasiosphaeris hirsuta]|uniref:Uncharacterized protein n=1 Tax=Lasiosphaeris hirsuta TaxID=260670 RepID=A0AA39ZX31_9PEZI|nr:hypothetical protein B0H67DRAFT_374248 [Lasiosphaeris hirsuta]